MYYFETVGHRGAPMEAPENTLLSFRRAIAIGADWIEFDLRESRDGILVVIHDDTVDRMTNGKGKVRDMTFKELRTLDAGNGQKIPSLGQVIRLAKGRVKMDIEIKERGIEEDVLQAIKRSGIMGQCMVSSFFYDSIKKVKELSPEAMTAAIMGRMPRDVEKRLDTLFNDVNTRTLMVRKTIALEPFVGEARRLGFRVGIWNADTPAEIGRFAAMDPSYLCSNYPERLVEFKQMHAIV
ncbi:MAG TPA: glycerophosphodiester phosphodiesterase family protein [Methanocella sp.]|nr:glycerophosphodiester phosphodiesterase family protein [Methanocella sp.]